MAANGELRVSARGQMSLPADARRRWNLFDGGDVGYLDLGDALLLVPGGLAQARRVVLEAITPDLWLEASTGFGDPELADE